MGPITPCSFKYGSKYIAVFVDDATRYVWAFSLGDKSSMHLAIGMLLKSVREVRGQDAKIKSFRLDNGTEYLTDNMKEVLKKEGITLLPVPPHTPNLNGTAERLNMDLQQKIRCLLIDSGFPKDFWAFALKFAIQIHNKTPKKAIDGKIPYTLFHERPCTIKYLKRFGSQCFVLSNSKVGKFDERTITGFLINCLDDSYLVIDPMNGKIWRSKNVDFTESVTYGDIFNDLKSKSVLVNSFKDISFGEIYEKEGSIEESALSPSRLVNDLASIDANLLEMFLDEESFEAFSAENEPSVIQ